MTGATETPLRKMTQCSTVRRPRTLRQNPYRYFYKENDAVFGVPHTPIPSQVPLRENGPTLNSWENSACL